MGGGVYREIPRRAVKPQPGYSPGTQEWRGAGCKMGVNPTWVPTEGPRLGANCCPCLAVWEQAMHLHNPYQ